MRSGSQTILSLAIGFLGGILAVSFEANLHPYAMSRADQAGIMRADRFELVDSSGHTLAYWGQDKPTDRVVLVFNDENGRPRAEFGTRPSQNNDGRSTFYKPFFALIGSDGKIRFQELLGNLENPLLFMGDDKTEHRLFLGHRFNSDEEGDVKDPWDNWSLVLSDPSRGGRNYLDIGATTALNSRRRLGYLMLEDSFGKRLSESPK